MPTLNEAIAALSRLVGFPESRSRVVARRLREAGKLPAGAPGVAPEVDLGNVIDLFVAIASDAKVHRVPDALATYQSLTPGGADLSCAPASVRATAGQQLLAIAALAAEGDNDMRRLRVEFVSSWPEIAIHFDDGSTQRFREGGSLAGHWDSTGHRKSITVNGAAFADAVRLLYGANQGANR